MANSFEEALIPLNTLDSNPEMIGNTPLVAQLVKIDPAAFVTGVITVDVASPFGLGKGEALGIVPLKGISATNELFGASVAAHATDAGYLTITLNAWDDGVTTNMAAFYALIIGRIHPKDVS